jgi:branched-chain amino acid transport system permease protein
VEFIFISLLNGLSYGLLLFMLSSGLTLIYSLMGVINFAHASFYMLGAYMAYAISLYAGFWAALLLAPLLVGIIGALVEQTALRRLHQQGHLAELLFTFGLAYVALEIVELVWGKSPVPYAIPAMLDGTLFTIYDTAFPIYRGFMFLVAIAMLLSIFLVMRYTKIGLIVQAALTHPHMAEALGHNVPRVFMLVFSAGCALAALAGVIGGNAFVTEPAMAASVGSIIFVVVIVGGLGSLWGAFWASIIIGIGQTFAVALDLSLWRILQSANLSLDADIADWTVMHLSSAQIAPMLPYLLMVIVLMLSPKGLMGKRDA